MSPQKVGQLNIRISEQGRKILYALQDFYGLSQAGVIELILRDVARQQGIDTKNPQRKLGSTLGTGKGGRHG